MEEPSALGGSFRVFRLGKNCFEIRRLDMVQSVTARTLRSAWHTKSPAIGADRGRAATQRQPVANGLDVCSLLRAALWGSEHD